MGDEIDIRNAHNLTDIQNLSFTKSPMTIKSI